MQQVLIVNNCTPYTISMQSDMCVYIYTHTHTHPSQYWDSVHANEIKKIRAVVKYFQLSPQSSKTYC
jgi:hypothetical protein